MGRLVNLLKTIYALIGQRFLSPTEVVFYFNLTPSQFDQAGQDLNW